MNKTLGALEKNRALLEFIKKRTDAPSGLAGVNKTCQTALSISTFFDKFKQSTLFECSEGFDHF